jgi:CubicO group peptidase (beta-lactamase class C family)
MPNLRTLFFVALLLSPLSLPGTDPDFARLETTALAEMKASNTPGAAVGIVRDGQIIWKKGLGLANVETNQPVDPEMLFRLGSTTKMFTAAAVVSLAEEQKIKLSAPIGNHITGIQAEIAVLTPHQLLTHTAGLTDESIMSGRHDDEALAAYARTMDQSWLFTEPGSIHSYANPGYWLAGLLCEIVEHKPYADVMADRLFQPLGMTRTTLRPTLAMTWPLALGHEVKNGKPAIVRPQADNAATWPAGQMYSSVPDLARFVTAIMDNGRLGDSQILSPTLIERLTSPYVPRPGDDEHYAYGLGIGQDRGVTIWQHGGSRAGYGSTIRMAPQQKIAVIILTNRTGSSLPKTAAAALELLLPFESRPTVAESQSQPLTEKQMADLAGRYTNNRQTIDLVAENGKLLIQRRGFESPLTSASLAWSGENRLALFTGDTTTDSARPTTTYFLVRDSSGLPQYLITGSRALKRQK